MTEWRPTAEYALYFSWTRFTEQSLGRYVPINHITHGLLQHVALDSDPPLDVVDGEEIRVITLEYDIDQLEATWTAKH